MNLRDKNPIVSVIIPAYNHEKYVGQTIRSVLDQTFQDFEIIITDDGSSDHTVAEIKKFTDSRIKLFLGKENQGSPVVTRNNLAHAKGRYIAWLASDDIFDQEKLEKQVKFLDRNPEYSAVFSKAKIIDDDGNDFQNEDHPYYHIFDQPNRTRYEWLNHFFYYGNCLCHPSVLIRREFCEITGYTDRRYWQLPDYDLWIRLCMISEIYIIQEQLVKFRVRDKDANASGNRPEARVRLVHEIVHILNNYLGIQTIDEFFRIFPDATHLFSRNPDKELIPYYIAMLALNKNIINYTTPGYITFAMNTLFNLFGDSRLAEKCAHKERFYYRDFADLRGQYDIYKMFG